MKIYNNRRHYSEGCTNSWHNDVLNACGHNQRSLAYIQVIENCLLSEQSMLHKCGELSRKQGGPRILHSVSGR
jgi:hypothetical protein